MNYFILALVMVALVGVKVFPRGFHQQYIDIDHTRRIEGLLALMVLFNNYAGSYMPTGGPDGFYFRIQNFLGQAIVAMFLFYSGFGMMAETDKSSLQYMKKLPGKALTLLIRFDLFVCLFVLVQNAVGRQYSAREILLALVSWQSVGDNNWYIFAILCLYVCLFAGFLLFRRKNSGLAQWSGTIVSWLLMLAYMAIMKKLGQPAYWYNTIICFAMGMLYYRLRGTIEKLIMRDRVYYIVFAVCAVLFVIASKYRNGRLLFYELWMALFVVLAVLFTMKVRLSGAVFDFLGRHIFSFFMFQRIPMIFLKHLGLTKLHPYVSLLIVLTATAIFAAVFDYIWNWLCRKAAALLTGTGPAEKQSRKHYIRSVIELYRKNQFLFEELVKRDFKQKYKRSILGMAWSVLSPLLNLLVMSLVFTNFFGRNTPHYTIYLFCGTLVYSYFRESTNGGMNALMSNSRIFTKVNIPKYMFLLSKNVSALINFGLTLIVFFIFVIFDGIGLHLRFLALIYPICCLVVFNIGLGLILSALFVFFRDTGYLYDIFTMLLQYMSAIFYKVETFDTLKQDYFYFNPIYCVIKYFRMVVIDGVMPPWWLYLLIAFYALLFLFLGGYTYRKYNQKFLYYV